MRYRPDIDGLRAVAVLSVIFYHLNPALVPAGFVGVDIFFVISGYLISLQIFREIDSQRFSILEFYRRRVKRIAPAMLVVLAVTLFFAQFMLRPEDSEEVARSGFWSLLSLANAYFWLAEDGSYFAAPSDQQPLLHFWSLAVEEQFYLIWPIVLLLCGGRIRSALFAGSITVIGVLSFVLGQYYFSVDPSFVYYMLPARAGELLVGALAAWWTHRKGPIAISGSANQGLASLGVALVVWSLIFISADNPFPGFAALVATMAVAALILSGDAGTTWVSNVLTAPPVVWVGKVSYSAYLWHWPVLAFLRYAGVEISFPIGTLVFGLTFGAAWLSYAYIETPFRRTRQGALAVFSRMYFVPAAALSVIAVVSLKTDGYIFHRYFPEYTSQLQQLRDSRQSAYRQDYVCQRRRVSSDDLDDPDCVLGPQDNPVSVVLWGDSNAAHYVGMIGAFSEAAGFRFRNIEVGACPPMSPSIDRFASALQRRNCQSSVQLVWPFLEKFKTVIISAYWTGYHERFDDFFDEFENTVNLLTESGANVILLGKAPDFIEYDRLCHEKALRFTAMNCDLKPIPLGTEIVTVNRKLQLIAARRENVGYFDANEFLCPNGLCGLKDENGIVRYYDSYHLTADGSRQLGLSIIDQSGVPDVFLALGE